MPAIALNSSSASSVAEPPEAWVSLPGSFLASAISSAIEFAGTVTLTITRLRDGDDQAERHEILLRVVGQIGERHWIDRHGAVVRDQQRVAVGRRLLHRFGADPHRRARAVLDHDRLAPFGLHLLGDHRAVVSIEPPGAVGTMIFTARSG